jgi:hypothetical protein
MPTYRDDLEGLEARAASLREQLAAVEARTRGHEASRARKLESAPHGPPVWMTLVLAVLVGGLAVMGVFVALLSSVGGG